METDMTTTGTPSSAWTRLCGGFGAGVGASVAMMAVMAVLRLTTNTISIPELMEGSLINLIGGQIESFFINALGVGGKALLLTSIVEGTLVLGGLLGLLFARFWHGRVFTGMSKWVQGLLYGVAVGLFLNVIFLPILQQGFFGSSAGGATAPQEIARSLYGRVLAPFGLPVWLEMFVLSIVFGLVLVSLLPWPQTANATGTALAEDSAGEQTGMGRRDFTRALGGGAVALVGGAVLWGVIRKALEAPTVAGVQEVDVVTDTPVVGTPTVGTSAASTPVPGTVVASAPATSTAAANTPGAGTPVANTPETATQATPDKFADVKPKLVPEITPVENFYITTKNFVDPTVDGASWSLQFSGLVDNPYSITLADLKALPAQERNETLACISNPIGGPLIGNGQWKGVGFAEMLKKAGPKPEATELIFRAADGYTDSIPLSVALNNGCFLAYEMNGAELVQKHGYPARLLVPDIYGMKNVKWITEVELASSDYKGYWESQGWDDVAEYQIMSRIDYPNQGIASGPVYIGGVAFAGSRGITKVEVSLDGGGTFAEATLRPSLGKDTWTQWTFPWIATSGNYTIMVRATDGTGKVQTPAQQDTYPNGATGWHTVNVQVG
jgi:DMSO/TMAO reductase YedYZ molybdopterin-dependent catalytic subunit